MRRRQIISIQEITAEGNNHMQETATTIQEERVGIHLETIIVVATHIHHILLLRHRVLDDMGNPLHMLGGMVGATNLHHMQQPNSGSSNNLIVPILEVGRLLQDLIPGLSSHRTDTAT